MISQGATHRRAFTLIEIMVVCAIIGIVLTMGIPSIYRRLHPESMQKAVTEIKYLCDVARGQAVLSGTVMKLVIRQTPTERVIEVAPGGTTSAPENPLAGYNPQPNRLESKNLEGEEWRMADRRSAPASPGPPAPPFKLPDTIQIEGIRLHLKDFTDDEVVEVNFYPNGTCDEFALFLAHRQENDRRQISLEVSTALVDIESDPRKFR
jgi:prepilin-type N-terminal cleavage/methylation domain-containing protein